MRAAGQKRIMNLISSINRFYKEISTQFGYSIYTVVTRGKRRQYDDADY